MRPGEVLGFYWLPSLLDQATTSNNIGVIRLTNELMQHTITGSSLRVDLDHPARCSDLIALSALSVYIFFMLDAPR